MHRTIIRTRVLLLFACALASGTAGSAQPTPGGRAQSEGLTLALVSLHERALTAEPDERTAWLREMATTAAARRQVLASMIETDPGQVLRVAFSAGQRASLPAEVLSDIEEHVQLEGTLEVLYEDYRWGARLRHVLHSGGTRVSLNFAADPPGLVTGLRVRARGVRIGDALALESGSTSVQVVSAAPLSNAFGEQRTLVLLVNFQDTPVQPYTTAYAHDVVFGTTSRYDLEVSFQQTWLAGDTVGWFAIAMNSTVCDSTTIASLARQAATAAGVNLPSYTRYVYAFAQNACTWWGLGSVGGNPSQAWINGDFLVRVVAHEMGHNFGLYHAHSKDCGATVIDAPCTTSDYGDTLDMMGGSSAHFNAFMKERLGWLAYGNSPPVVTVETGGTYWLEPFESPSAGGAKALKILKAIDPTTGSRTWYYVEFRQPIGFDSFLSSNTNVLTGVIIRTGSESSGNTSYLLDLTPETTSWSDPALGSGRSFTDTTAGVTIGTVSTGATGALVSVSFSNPLCTRANPTVTMSPSQSPWVSAGTPYTYTVSVTSADSPGCAPAAFNLTASVPTGWTATLGSSALTLAPGASASTTLQVMSTPTAANGSQAITAFATNGADATRSGSASAAYLVLSSLTVQVSTDRTSYTRNQTVSVTTRVSAGSSPSAGATLSVRITKSNGSVVTATATADAAGLATVTWRLAKRDPIGTYQVTAAASAAGLGGAGTTSFAVR